MKAYICHVLLFFCTVEVEGTTYEGIGITKKAAMKAAAAKAVPDLRERNRF